jgi:hypothetical protein
VMVRGVVAGVLARSPCSASRILWPVLGQGINHELPCCLLAMKHVLVGPFLFKSLPPPPPTGCCVPTCCRSPRGIGCPAPCNLAGNPAQAQSSSPPAACRWSSRPVTSAVEE